MRVFLRDAEADTPRGRSALVDAIAVLAGVAPSAVQLRRRCARCGSEDHGKPMVVSPTAPDGVPFQASLSRAGGRVVVAVTTQAPVGVDIERTSDVARASIDAAAFHPAEYAALLALPGGRRDDRRALLWTAKEAVLKAAGVGLAIDPALLELRVRGGRVELVGWPPTLALGAAPRIQTFELAGGIIGALAARPGAGGGIDFLRLP